ncbi:hypothetical protein ACFYUV_20480 [Nonomuraea sp. NPDC003560]|uniref:hypothetical protein n=1 Tax=Nonomuraea sp. NPDC003560 TaxID=3364341 RepID=UPI0036CA3E9E
MSGLVWVLLAAATVNTFLGAYTVIKGHPPAWMSRRYKRRPGRLTGWANLLTSVFIALLVINMSGGVPLDASLPLIVIQALCGFGAPVLMMVDRGEAQAHADGHERVG